MKSSSNSIIVSLESIQEALEKEVQKFEEIGRILPLPDSYWADGGFADDPAFPGSTISDQNMFRELHIDGKEQNFIQPQKVLLTKFDSEAHMLKSKLDDVSATIKAKEYQIRELESILYGGGGLQGNLATPVESLPEKCREWEIELEGLLQQRIECEVEYILVSETTQRSSIMAAEDQISLFEEQKSLACEQSQMLHKLKEAEHKAMALKRRAEDVEVSCDKLLTTEEVLKTQKKLYKRILYFISQLILLLIAFVIFKLRPRTSEIVPT